jgi:haloalkane dehalogenase
MEAILLPRRWADFPNGRDAMFRAMRSADGERLVLDENFFIETVLPKSIIRQLSAPEMDAYRAPFRDRDTRLPTLIWPRELPIEGEPADVAALVTQYGQWLAKSSIPKLFIAAEPGSILVGRALDFCRQWPRADRSALRKCSDASKICTAHLRSVSSLKRRAWIAALSKSNRPSRTLKNKSRLGS